MQIKLLIRLAISYVVLLMAISCTPDSTASYQLPNDTDLHQHQAGDRMVYQVSGNKTDDNAVNQNLLGKITQSWSASDLTSSPDNDDLTDVKLFTETIEFSDLASDTQQQYIRQNENGAWFLVAQINQNEQVLWAKNDNDEFNTLLFAWPPNDQENPISAINYQLVPCENSRCEPAIANVIKEVRYYGIETTKTPFAEFEAYKFSLHTSQTIATPDDFSSLQNIISAQFLWVYPPLGIIKYTMEQHINTGESNQQIDYIASLSQTNISLPETQ